MTTKQSGALVAALGVAAAILVASPAAPAQAVAVHTTPVAPTAARTVSITAHHVNSEGVVSPFSNPLDITCTLVADTPHDGGTTRSNSFVAALSIVTCKYDIDGTVARVDQINLSATLYLDGTVMDYQPTVTPGSNRGSVETGSEPCEWGLWRNYTGADVKFPDGYTPQWASASDENWDEITRCPGDHF